MHKLIHNIASGSTDLPKPSAELLSVITRWFVHNTTYVTIDVHNQYRIPWDPKLAFQRSFISREGALCYQTNGALYYLLRALGFSADFFSAFVRSSDDTALALTRPSHMTLLVSWEDQHYCIDPGWGDTPELPIPLTGASVHKCGQAYRMISLAENRYALQKYLNQQWITQYDFDPRRPKNFADFDAEADYVYSREYPFHSNFVASTTTQQGHLSLFNNSLKIRNHDGIITDLNLLEMGGVERVLTQKMGLPQHYVSQFKLHNMPSALKENIAPFWNKDEQVTACKI